MSSPSLTNVTFSGNAAGYYGGGMVNDGYDGARGPNLVNCILWGNTAPNAPQIYNSGATAMATLSYSLIQGGCAPGVTCGSGMLYTDPQFIAPIAAAPTTSGNYRLQAGSPAINAGNNLSVTVSTDLDGNPRLVNGTVDMGAYEADYLLLTTQRTGTGGGVITSDPAGINCGPTCSYEFPANTVVTLTATPLISSTFTGWNGAVNTTTHSLILPITQAGQLTATFTLNSYTITPTAGANGSIMPGMLQTVNYGESLTFTIVPTTGYHVAGVYVDGISVGAVGLYPFTNITADHTITAVFALNTYVITPTAGANGSITPAMPQTVTYGASKVFTITPNPGYHITEVQVDGASVGISPIYTFTNITADHTITAAFALSCQAVQSPAFAFIPLRPFAGETVWFTGTTAGGSAPFTYTWSWGDGTVDGTGVTLSHAFPLTYTARTYTVTMEVSNACSAETVAQAMIVIPRRIYLPLVVKTRP